MNHQSPSANTQEWKMTDLKPECFRIGQETLLAKGVENTRGRKHPNTDVKIDRKNCVQASQLCTALDEVTITQNQERGTTGICKEGMKGKTEHDG